MKILLICTGNTCRSTMAEVLLRQIIASDSTSVDVEVYSAGLAAIEGMPATEQAIKVMQEKGLNLSNHSSRLVSPDLLEADLILTMTLRHKQVLLRANSKLAEKTFTLKEYAGEKQELDILDPYGGSVDVYRATAEEIQKYLELAWERLTAGSS